MDPTTRDYFAALISLTQSALTNTTVIQLDFTLDRAILEIHGQLGQLDIRLKEIVKPAERLYSYYVVARGKVVVGFDNYPDRRALQQKYGQDFKNHLSELIPHQHGSEKTTLELSEKMSVEKFLDYLSASPLR
ncbi:MAG: hypothetical protein HC875_33925 [Anaerolineales bacterium]|nr:hypothetical protein [Anaerolineales bacterium]